MLSAGRQLQVGLLLLVVGCTPAAAVQPTTSTVPSGAATDCDVGITGGTACIYLLGQCQTDSDCTAVLASYGLNASTVPSDSKYACVDSKCGLETPTTVCDASSGLPTCDIAPTPAPMPGPSSNTSASPPVSILPSDCYLTNEAGTECAYELGTCQANSDCTSVLASYLSTFGVTSSQIPANATYGCLEGDKCELFFPSDGCLKGISLPMCPVASAPGPGIAPVTAPDLAPAAAGAPVSILPSDCYLENTADTECEYVLGMCRNDTDCPSVLSSYLSTFGVSNSQIPSNATYGCLSDQKCALLFPTDGCLADISLPTCTVAPGPAPVSTPAVAPAPAPAAPLPPVSILSTDCYFENQNDTFCFYKLGECDASTNCEPVVSSYLVKFGIKEVSPKNAVFCYEDKCILDFNSSGCYAAIDLPFCSSAPGPSVVMPPSTPAPAPAATAPAPSVSVLPPPPPPPPSAGGPFATLSGGPLLVAVLVLTASLLMSGG